MTWLSTEIYHDFKWSMSSLVDIFNQQLVPAMQQWAVLTKDYVLDLFWRYIQYAIAMDILSILFTLPILYLLYIWYKKVSLNDTSRYKDNTVMYCLLTWVFAFILMAAIYFNFNHIIQSIFTPELTIYEKIVELKQ